MPKASMISFWGLNLNSIVVHLVEYLAELLGRVHRNDPFAVCVTFA